MRLLNKYVLRILTVVGLGLLSAVRPSSVSADIPGPDDIYRGREESYPHSVFEINTLQIFKYAVATLLFELPVFFVFGFKTKRALGFAAAVNVVSLFVFHLIENAFLLGSFTPGGSMLIAELLVVAFESIILVSLLKKELSVHKILLAVVVANLVSATIGGYLVNTVLGGF